MLLRSDGEWLTRTVGEEGEHGCILLDSVVVRIHPHHLHLRLDDAQHLGMSSRTLQLFVAGFVVDRVMYY